MGFIKQLLGICHTGQAQNPDGWRYEGGKLVIDLNRTPELNAPGGGARFEGQGLPQRVLVVHGADGKYHAYVNKCAHIGKRRLDPVDGGARLQCCSVGQSVYDLSGKRLSGSARDDIHSLPVTPTEETLTISL